MAKFSLQDPPLVTERRKPVSQNKPKRKKIRTIVMDLTGAGMPFQSVLYIQHIAGNEDEVDLEMD